MTSSNLVARPIAAGAAEDESTSPTHVFMNTPPAVLHLLGYSAPFIRTLTPVVQALTWTSPNPWLSWLLLATWWIICLLGDSLFKYGLNTLCLLVLGLGYLAHRPSTKRAAKPKLDLDTSMSPERLQILLEDARTFNRAVQDLIYTYYVPARNLVVWKRPSESRLAASYLLTSYPIYLAITRYLGVRYILLSIGTLALTWHARWAQILRKAVSKSLLFRWVSTTMRELSISGCRNMLVQLKRGRKAKDVFFSRTSPAITELDGKTLIDPTISVPIKQEEAVPESEPDVEFVFTVYQNERWWMGLDWTQALLPNERPPW